MAGTDSRTRLSVVATSRNDDHGGHLIKRMQWFVDGLAWNSDRRGARVELVLVEWNPPEDRAPLIEALHWPGPNTMLSVRILTVPPSEHRRILPEGGVPMMQMIAKNVGIRRALGDNVLATNIDILLSPELFDLATRPVGDGTVWRADRNDVEFPFDDDVVTIEGALAFCRSHPIRYERRDGIYYPGYGRTLPIYQSFGDFLTWQISRLPVLVRRLVGNPADRTSKLRLGRLLTGPDTPGPRVRSSGTRPTASQRSSTSLLFRSSTRTHAVTSRFSEATGASIAVTPNWLCTQCISTRYSCIRCMRTAWKLADAKPPAVAYHMEHAVGSGWTPEGHEEHYAAVEQRGMPHITPAKLRAMKRSLRHTQPQGRPLQRP